LDRTGFQGFSDGELIRDSINRRVGQLKAGKEENCAQKLLIVIEDSEVLLLLSYQTFDSIQE